MASFRHFAVRKPSEIFEMMKQNSLKKMSKRKHVRCIWLALWSSWQRHFPKIEVLPVRLTRDHIGTGIKWRMIRVTMATNSEISACRTSLGRYGYRPLTCSSQIIGRLLSSSASILGSATVWSFEERIRFDSVTCLEYFEFLVAKVTNFLGEICRLNVTALPLPTKKKYFFFFFTKMKNVENWMEIYWLKCRKGAVP